MMRLFLTELKKTRRRHIGLVYAAALGLMIIWALWAMSRMQARNDVITQQGYYYLLANFPLMNSFFLPVIIACAESRLCDMELKGNTFKLLCTMQPRHSIYHIKLLLSFLYLLFFTTTQTALIYAFCSFFHVTQPAPAENILLFFLASLTVGTVLIIIQQSLTLLSENQLFPLFVGVGGTFAGIFSGFFPQMPVKYLLPWAITRLSSPSASTMRKPPALSPTIRFHSLSRFLPASWSLESSLTCLVKTDL